MSENRDVMPRRKGRCTYADAAAVNSSPSCQPKYSSKSWNAEVFSRAEQTSHISNWQLQQAGLLMPRMGNASRNAPHPAPPKIKPRRTRCASDPGRNKAAMRYKVVRGLRLYCRLMVGANTGLYPTSSGIFRTR